MVLRLLLMCNAESNLSSLATVVGLLGCVGGVRACFVVSCRNFHDGWKMRWAGSLFMPGLVDEERGEHRQMITLCETAIEAHRFSDLVKRICFHCIAATQAGHHVKVCALCSVWKYT